MDYKLDRYVVTNTSIDQISALGTGETYRVLKELADAGLGTAEGAGGYHPGLNSLKKVGFSSQHEHYLF